MTDNVSVMDFIHTYTLHTYIIYIRLCVYISRICDVYTYNFCRGPLLLILLLGPVFARVWIWFTRAYPLHTLQCCRSTGRKTSEVRQYNSDVYVYICIMRVICLRRNSSRYFIYFQCAAGLVVYLYIYI